MSELELGVYSKICKNPVLIRKILLFILFIVLLAGIFPFLQLARFNHPSADDFCFVVKENGKTLWDIQKTSYTEIDGRYFFTLLRRLNPMFHNSFHAYKIYPVLLLVFFLLSVFILLRTALKSCFLNIDILIISLLLVVLYLTKMPSTAQGLYWFTGCTIYQVPNILCLIFLTAVLKIAGTEKRISRAFLIVLSAVLCFAIIGSNEISLILINGIVILLCINVIVQKGKLLNYLFVFLMVCFVASVIEILAPGNFIRLDTFPYSANFELSLYGTVYSLLLSLSDWMVPLILLTGLYLFFWGRNTGNLRRNTLFAVKPLVFYLGLPDMM